MGLYRINDAVKLTLVFLDPRRTNWSSGQRDKASCRSRYDSKFEPDIRDHGGVSIYLFPCGTEKNHQNSDILLCAWDYTGPIA
jgi:hypothetical protein